MTPSSSIEPTTVRRLWVITGVLEVDECATTTDGAGRPCPRRRPLVGVAVELGGEVATALTDRVGARTRTDEAGRFRLLTNAVERPPAVRLRIHLHDEWLAVSGPLALQPGVEEWMSIPTPTVAGPAATLLDLGSLTLREGAPGRSATATPSAERPLGTSRVPRWHISRRSAPSSVFRCRSRSSTRPPWSAARREATRSSGRSISTATHNTMSGAPLGCCTS